MAARDSHDEQISLTDAVAAHLDQRSSRRAPIEPPGSVDPMLGEETIDLRDSTQTDDDDTTKRSEGLASLVRRANHDDLTGLANRSWFTRAVDRARSERGPNAVAALFLIDLDGFKAVNDTWGHGAGDTVLVEVAQRLATIFPATAFTARFGGDEFAMWLPDCTEAQACLVAERLVATIAEPVSGSLLLSVGASIGWVICDDDAPMHALLSRADIAMYAIKETGGHGQRIFDRELASERVEGRVLQREIRQALDKDQFRLAAQPLVSVDGQVVGHEALARWAHPRRGQLAPPEFLAAVASGGNGEAFDHYMLDQAIRELDSSKGVNRVWVNLSGDSLNDAMVQRLSELKAQNTNYVDQLVFELSENASADSAAAIASIQQIADLGYGLAIDDFGSGFCRLGAMASLPISYVKIDQQFTEHVAQDESAALLCAAVVDLIHAIGAEVVAEGVEHQSQAEVLTRMGCEYLQGFLFGKPLLRSDSPAKTTPPVPQAQVVPLRPARKRAEAQAAPGPRKATPMIQMGRSAAN